MAKLRGVGLSFAFVAASMLAASHAFAAADALCKQLRTLEETPLATSDDGKPVRRWVQFMWWGDWMIGGGWGCRHSGDQVSKQTCAYLIENTSKEFHNSLPLRALTCRGYRVPQLALYDWDGWAAAVTLRGREQDRQLVMDVDLSGKGPASTVRFSVIPDDPSKNDKEPPPLLPTDIPASE